MKSEKRVHARKLLNESLQDSEEFMAFCQDYFHEVYRRFTHTMDLLACKNLLLSHVQTDEILQRLHERYPERCRKSQVDVWKASSSEIQQRSGTQLLPEDHIDSTLKKRAFGHSDPILHCDRRKQLAAVRAMVLRPGHELVVIPGGQGQAHKFFLARLEGAVPHQPARRVIGVRWPRRRTLRQPTFPTTRRDILAALAQALGGQEGVDLPQLFAQQLRNHSLLIWHPVVTQGLHDETLMRYYTEWLPEYLTSYHDEHSIKLIQPIEWQTGNLLRRLFSSNKSRITKRQAQDYIKKLEMSYTQILPIEITAELEPLQRSDVQEFLSHIGYARELSINERNDERMEFVKEVFSDATTSEQILRKIAELLPDD